MQIEILSFILIFIIFSITKIFVAKKGASINHTKLPDIFHHDSYNLKSFRQISDYFLLCIISIFCFYIYQNKIPRSDIFEFIRNLTMCMIIKTILMSSTILPDASGRCSVEQKSSVEFFLTSGCNDLVFSFHQTILLLILSIMKKNNLISLQNTILISITEALLICLTQNHYTLDVILSFIIVPYVIHKKYYI